MNASETKVDANSQGAISHEDKHAIKNAVAIAATNGNQGCAAEIAEDLIKAFRTINAA